MSLIILRGAQGLLRGEAMRLGKLALLFVGVSAMGCPQPEGTQSAGDTSNSASGGASAVSAGDGSDARVAANFAVPQEELVRSPDAIKVSGTITIKDFAEGLLQIDVTPPTTGSVQPITVARFKSSGPFELYLPPTATEVNLTAILDLKGNGPDAEDPKASYSGNPLKVTGKEITGIELTIDKGGLVQPPPVDPSSTLTTVAPTPSGTPAPGVPTSGETIINGDSSRAGSAAPASSPAPAAGTAVSAPTTSAPSTSVPPTSASPEVAPAPATKGTETRAANVPDVLKETGD